MNKEMDPINVVETSQEDIIEKFDLVDKLKQDNEGLLYENFKLYKELEFVKPRLRKLTWFWVSIGLSGGVTCWVVVEIISWYIK